jgi:sugar O-acyltransferase (sialic acid O-acetyltransferase NeuD family)
MKKLLIFGAGGHAKVVYNIALKIGNYEIMGFVDTTNAHRKELFGYQIYNDISIVKESFFDGCIIAIGDDYSRKIIRDEIIALNRNIKFATLIDPNAVIGKNVNIGEGTVVMPSATINTCCNIANHCIINTAATIDHECTLEGFASVGPGAVLGGKVKIGELSAIGLGAKIIEKVHIGRDTVIGAGSLVLKDVKDSIIAYGVPAKEIRFREANERYLR